MLHKFESGDFFIMTGYEISLTSLYGNYMEFPPIDKRNERHDAVYEPDIPYKEYCSKYYGVKY